jgi:hypothetical protein
VGFFRIFRLIRKLSHRPDLLRIPSRVQRAPRSLKNAPKAQAKRLVFLLRLKRCETSVLIMTFLPRLLLLRLGRTLGEAPQERQGYAAVLDDAALLAEVLGA